MPRVATLDGGTIRALITRADALEAVRRSLVALAVGEAVLPGELAMDLDAGEIHVKGAYLRGHHNVAFKVATGFPGNARSGLAVNDGFTIALDAETGAPIAFLMDHGWLTELRTAAAGALAADLLARHDASRVAIIGAGAQAGYQLDALRDVRDIRHVRIWNRTVERAIAFAESADTVPVVVAETVEQAVADADIVVTATASRTALLRAEWLRPGTHVTAMGADFAGKQELHPDVLRRADVVVADRIDVCARVGELRSALAAGAVGIGDVIEFADLVAGAARGRTGEQQITVIDQCGLGIYDAAMADAVLSRYADRP